MKMAADTSKPDVESSLCDLVRLATVNYDLLLSLMEHYQRRDVPNEFVEEIENIIVVSGIVRDGTVALMKEFSAAA